MSLIRFLCFSLFLICILKFSEAENNTKENADALINLFANDKWKNFNDVKEVFFYNKVFFLETNFEKSIDLYNCNNKVRVATLVLGCSYVKDLKTFYFMFEQFRTYCEKLYGQQNLKTYAYDCTKKLLKLINKLYSLLKIMQGALNALDILHTNSWDISKTHDFLFIRLLSDLQNNHEDLKNYIHLNHHSIVTQESLKTIATFLEDKLFIINKRSTHCKYNPYNLYEMWHEWIIEYKTNEFDKLLFFDYLSKKLHEIIKQIIFDKFMDLGFKFELWAQKIVVPKQLNSVVDIKPNYTFPEEMIALIQNESNEYTKLTISNEELEVPVENPGMPETINFFPGVICNKELEVPDVNPRTPELINFFQEDKDLKVTSEDPKTIELIDFFEKEVPSGDPKTPELIDFLEQGLNPGVSTEDILEPLDIDKKKITMFNFL
ncbi:uncharacterized protein LOC126908461 isoform X10 [Daktulosphaira vitifoliae]|uniref:uncharacterized protein LOC126908461 isoform X10 n=1 Tax=Daktulosphaira vitifoliae TaxID=58002 RepID=UPI0021AAF431|nr:uncharacterized protein LOC126908461 isoform X10 [Daktulosphaira vitifoliae]